MSFLFTLVVVTFLVLGAGWGLMYHNAAKHMAELLELRTQAVKSIDDRNKSMLAVSGSNVYDMERELDRLRALAFLRDLDPARQTALEQAVVLANRGAVAEVNEIDNQLSAAQDRLDKLLMN